MKNVSIFARILRKTSKKNLVQLWVPFGKNFENFKLIMSKTIKIWDLLIRLNTNAEVWLQEYISITQFWNVHQKQDSDVMMSTTNCRKFPPFTICKFFKILLISGAAPYFLVDDWRGGERVGFCSEFCKWVAGYWLKALKSSYKGLVEGYNLLLEEYGLAQKLETNLQIKILCTFLL